MLSVLNTTLKTAYKCYSILFYSTEKKRPQHESLPKRPHYRSLARHQSRTRACSHAKIVYVAIYFLAITSLCRVLHMLQLRNCCVVLKNITLLDPLEFRWEQMKFPSNLNSGWNVWKAIWFFREIISRYRKMRFISRYRELFPAIGKLNSRYQKIIPYFPISGIRIPDIGKWFPDIGNYFPISRIRIPDIGK